MSGDSTFGNSNIAAASSSSDSDERDESEIVEEQSSEKSNQLSINSQSDQSAIDEWRKSNAATVAKLNSIFDNCVKDMDDSIEAAEKRFRSRRRPFSSNRNQVDREKRQSEAAAAAFDITSESEDEIVFKKPLSFSQRHAHKNNNAEQMAQNLKAFDVTDSSIEEEHTRVTRFSKKHSIKSKTKVDANYFDTTDESLVVDKPPVEESKMPRFSRGATRGRKLTEADINAFDISDEDEEGDNQGEKNEEEEEEEEEGDDLVLELDKESAVGKDNENLEEEEGASNSMDESEESGDEADNDKNQTLETQSPVEDAGGEDSLDEEVDEEGTERRKSDENVSNKEERGVGDEQNNIVVEGGSCNEQSSLLLEYHLSTDNHSGSRVVAESHDKRASFISNTSMTVDITRRFTQHGLQFLEVAEEKSRDVGSQNFEKSFDGIGNVYNVSANSAKMSLQKSFDGVGNVLNVSANSAEKSLGPVEYARLSPMKQIPDISSSDHNNRSLRSRNNSVNKSLDLEEEEMNRSLRSGKDLANRRITPKSSAKQNIKSPNDSKQTNKRREDLMNDSEASNRSLRTRTRGESNKSIIDGSGSRNNGKSGNELFMDVINESQKEVDEVDGINRSLRNRTGNGNSSKSMSEKEGSKVNSMSASNIINDSQKEEKGNSRSFRNKRGRGDMNKIVGHKRDQGSKETSSLYNSLDSFGEEHLSSVTMLQIPQSVNESAVINNSLDSIVNVTRQDPSLDEIMPAPRSLPARKRRLAKVDTPSFSSLAQKKKKNIVGETDSIFALAEKQNDLVAINNNREVVGTIEDYKCPKLKKPEPWATTRLYDWVIERLEPRYKLRSRLRAEDFVVLLCSTVKTVIKKEANYEKDIEDLKYEMARLNLIENLHQFFMFIYKFLPWQFQDKSLPLPQAFIEGPVVTFEKGTLYDPIL